MPPQDRVAGFRLAAHPLPPPGAALGRGIKELGDRRGNRDGSPACLQTAILPQFGPRAPLCGARKRMVGSACRLAAMGWRVLPNLTYALWCVHPQGRPVIGDSAADARRAVCGREGVIGGLGAVSKG